MNITFNIIKSQRLSKPDIHEPTPNFLMGAEKKDKSSQIYDSS